MKYKMKTLNNFLIYHHKKLINLKGRTLATASCTDFNTTELTENVKHSIENYWRKNLNDDKFVFDKNKENFYCLSMFPYPSGNLHMGHVRVYTLSDAMARFYRMNGKNVLHPMGWDSFGLPAENAAIERKIQPNYWTKQNIEHMRSQLMSLGFSFDWSKEIYTCNPEYYKWTQLLFIKLFKSNLVYQKEALVNWDPIDKTVLADEQVDSNGFSWRSGAKVEKKILNQWFIKTTKFAEQLLNGLDNIPLYDWKDIIKLQKHWIGDCNGYLFNFEINRINKKLSLWEQNPEYFLNSSFVVLKNDHVLKKYQNDNELLIDNPFSKKYPKLKIIFSDSVDFPEFCDSKLGTPWNNEKDRVLADSLQLEYDIETPDSDKKQNILIKANQLNLGGYKVSSKLKDWLISRQRYWGTPIPIVHCDQCGTVPINENDLPVLLPEYNSNTTDNKWAETTCPNCEKPAKRECDTMDTFVDSSWYFLRYLDPTNDKEMFDSNIAKYLMPVDLYIGGKEHAVLHLYYARFINYFLHSINLVPEPEPFKRLIVQGMVMGRSYQLKKSGKYLKENQVEIVDLKKNKAIEKETGEPVTITWEKMSKSKLNGVDPAEVVGQYGADSTRLIILGNVAPTSHRNWSPETFPGILNWQKRLWLTINDFYMIRNSNESFESNEEFHKNDRMMFDARNYYLKGVTFNYKASHQLSVAISKMQGLTNSIRRANKTTIKFSPQFERALAAQIIILAPMAPFFASELWSKFVHTPNRLNQSSNEINWEKDVLEQNWPDVDMNYELDLCININGNENCVHKIPRYLLDKITKQECIEIALEKESVKTFINDKDIKDIRFELHPGIEASLDILLKQIDKKEKKLKPKKSKTK